MVTITVNLEDYGYDCLILEDGKILITGITSDVAGYYNMLLVRLNADGTIDEDFGTDGYAFSDLSPSDDMAYALAVDAEGRILVAGSVYNDLYQSVPTIVRFNEDGTPDLLFGNDGVAHIAVTNSDNKFNNISVQPDGKIVASGQFEATFNYRIVLVVRFNEDGTPDNTFSDDGMVITPVAINDNSAYGMKLTPDSKILVTGFVTQADYGMDMFLMQYTADGVLDDSFGTDGKVIFDNADMDVAYDLVLQDDGRILLAGGTGTFTDGREFALWRYTAAGVADISFNGTGFVHTQVSGFMDEANGLAIQADGKIVLAGKSHNGMNYDFGVVRYTNEGPDGLNENDTFSDATAVYPNPVLQNARIDLQATSPQTIEIMDGMGKKVMTLNTSGTTVMEMDLSALAAGVYTIRIDGMESSTSVGRFIKL